MPLGTNNSEVQLALGNGSPDATLSQFLQGSPNDQMQNVPANPFDRSSYPEPSSTGPVGSPGMGNTYVMNNQSNVRNELHVSLDPLLVAHANQAVEQSRANILSQAQRALDQSREQLRKEATQVVGQAHEAARAEALHMINQVHSTAARTVEEARSEATEVFQRASCEVNMIRDQASTKIARIKGEAQRTVALLEGRIQELMHELSHMEAKTHGMVEERNTMITHLVDRIQEQDSKMSDLKSTIARMQGNAMRQPFETGNGAEIKIHTPEGFGSTSQGQPVGQPLVHRSAQQASVEGLQVGFSSLAQDSRGQKFGEKPLGSVRRSATAKDEGSSKKDVVQRSKSSSPPVEDIISNMKSMLAQIEQQVSRSPSAREPSDKRSSSSSSSSQPGGGGGSPGAWGF